MSDPLPPINQSFFVKIFLSDIFALIIVAQTLPINVAAPVLLLNFNHFAALIVLNRACLHW